MIGEIFGVVLILVIGFFGSIKIIELITKERIL